MTTSEEFGRLLLQRSVGRVCSQLGLTGVHQVPLDVMTDLLRRYILQLGRISSAHAEDGSCVADRPTRMVRHGQAGQPRDAEPEADPAQVNGAAGPTRTAAGHGDDQQGIDNKPCR